MRVFTTTRDTSPYVFFSGRLPERVEYVRILVTAPDREAAEAELERLHLARRYAEVLHEPTNSDSPAALVGQREMTSTKPAAYLVYRIDPSREQENEILSGADTRPVAPFEKPRFYLARLTDAADVETLGRIRVVGMGSPAQPWAQITLTEDMAGDDPVAMPADREGGDLGSAMGDLMPAGALGYLVAGRERRLDRGLPDVADDLAQVIARIQRARMSSDKRVAWGRDSGRLLDLSRRLAELAADAASVETVLQAGQ